MADSHQEETRKPLTWISAQGRVSKRSGECRNVRGMPCTVPAVETVSVPAVALALADRSALESVLSPNELSAWSQRRPGTRRDEWLAGRVALKRAVHRFATACGRRPTDVRDIEVTASREDADLGRPQVGWPAWVSIAHSHGIAAAAAGAAPVGIDVEGRQRPWPREVAAVVDRVGGEARGRRHIDAAGVWACVEAVLKHRGCGLRFGADVIEVTSVARHGSFEWRESPALPPIPFDPPEGRFGRWWRTSDHAFALVWDVVAGGETGAA